MSLKHKFILLFAIGFSLGIIICTIITSTITTNVINDGKLYICDPAFTNMFGNELVAFIIQCLVSGLYAALCMGFSIVYEIEDWSILRATVTHFLITFTMFVITATFLKWWDFNNIEGNIIFVVIIVGVYFLIWLFQYIKYKIEVKKIKKDINEFKKKNKDTE